MKFEVLVSETALKQLSKLEDKTKERLKQHLLALSADPFKRRSGADIKKLKGFSSPSLYHLRVGDYRAIYTVQENKVKITEVFRRGKGYAWLD